MQKYGGQLVYSLRDEYGLIEVVDSAGIRSLHFETAIQQSSIDLKQPERLVFEYYRAMCLALLFHPTPSSLLILGLGGGALCRFLLEARPDSDMVTVEFREGVVDVAYEWFGLPDLPRLETWIADAHTYLHNTDRQFPVIFVDLYDALGMSDSLTERRFFNDCMDCLTDSGILSINLWHSDKKGFQRSCQILEELSAGRVSYISVDDANTVALVFKEQQTVRLRDLKLASQRLEASTGLNLAPYLKKVQNRAW